MGAMGEYSDAIRFGTGNSFADLLSNWCRYHSPFVVLSTALHLVYQRWPLVVDQFPPLPVGYLLTVLLFLPCELLFTAACFLLKEGQAITLQASMDRLMAMHRFTWFTEFTWTTGTYISVVALCSWHRNRQREQAWHQSQTDNLNLRLELEQQRLQSLRDQLEPHFLFNALSAITALVRQGDGPLALAAINRLSELLRYALEASERDWVPMADELKFIDNYLALQRLRYGDRLRVRVEGGSDAVLGADCPPLLLQPMIENAMRHDLDRHDGASDLCLRFERHGEELSIVICNPLRTGEAGNPGAGLGLRSTRTRLQLACGPQASLDVQEERGRFRVDIRMPMYSSHRAA
jgi:hypothetical protein